MATVQLALLTGALGGFGVWLVVREFVPTEPSLQHALERLGTQRAPTATVAADRLGATERIGLYAHTRLGSTSPLLQVNSRDLALLRIPVHRLLGEKIALFLLGVLFVPLLTLVLGLGGVALPVPVSAGASLLLGALLFMLPDVRARAAATTAREAFARAVGAYIEFVALGLLAGTGTRESLDNAATIANSWPFERIREELSRSRMSGQAPWTGLHQLADELGVPQLGDLADIMRRAGVDGAEVYKALRARGRGLRIELLTNEKAQANARSNEMNIPSTLLVLITLTIMAIPAVLGIM